MVHRVSMAIVKLCGRIGFWVQIRLEQLLVWMERGE